MNKQPLPFVSAIVPVWNDAERLKLCLEALEKQTYPQNCYEVLVVDNGSDESIESVVNPFPRARMIVEPRRGSYAARNAGILRAKGEILAFTDADCIPDPDWIETGSAHFLNVPNCGLVGGHVEFSFKNPDRPTAAELYDQFFFLQQKLYIEREKFAATANIFTAKRVFETVGLFNADLKTGGDREWGERVHAAGYALSYTADARIRHPARHSLKDLQKKVKRVARATYCLHCHKDNFPLLLLRFLLADLKPPLRIWGKIRWKGRQPNFRQRVEFMGMVVWMKAVKAREKMALFLSDRRRKNSGQEWSDSISTKSAEVINPAKIP